MKTPDEIKKGLGCYIKQHSIGCDDIYCRECELYEPNSAYTIAACTDAHAYILQLEEDKKRLQERICNQRRQLKLLHAMYEWALSVLQKANMNDRAKFQRYLLDRGIDLNTDEN